MEDVEKALYEKMLGILDLSYDYSDGELIALIREEISALCKDKYISLKQKALIEKHVFNSLRKLDVLEDLLADEDITEIMINGPKNIYVERAGQIYKTELSFSSNEKLNDVIQKIVGINNKIVNETNPIVDTRLADGSRVNIVLSPASVDGSVMTIRRFPKEQMTMKKLRQLDSLSDELISFLKKLVKARYNIFVCGGTGSGKTSFLNAMGAFIPDDERVITIEDSAELQIKNVKNIVRLEARDKNLEGRNEITIRDLLKTSLRMRPDRVIIGECRGAEALEMLQAFNTGHDGSFSTGHANSCKDMLYRLETMVLMDCEIPLSAVRQQIASGIDIFVHLGRLRDGTRKVLGVYEVDGIKEGEISLRELFRFEETGMQEGRIIGEWKKANELKHTQKLQNHGLNL